MRQAAATTRPIYGAGSGRVLALIVGLIAVTCGCRQPSGCVDRPMEPESRGAVIGGLSLSLPDGFFRKAHEQSREPLLNIPNAFTDQVFAS